jgi:hypothetical protein
MGETYFGLFVSMTDATDPPERDTRPPDVRVADVVAHDLGGRAPVFFTVNAVFPTRSLTEPWPSGEIRTAKARAGSALAVVNWVLGGSNAPCC